jgi:hypothetical protein
MNKENSGIAVLKGTYAEMPIKTVIVLGLPRGGTSMVSGILAKMGIYLGPEYKLAPLYENRDLDKCFKTGDKTKARQIIASYNEEYSVWGIKLLPRAWWFWAIYIRVREPVYIVVFRDALAIAKRKVISLKKSLLKEMFIASWNNLLLLIFLALTKRPTLLLSYEKALLAPENVVLELSDFLDIKNTHLLKNAVAFITPSPKDYLMRSTTFCQLDDAGNYFGYLDIVESNKIAGWVQKLREDKPLTVEIIVNGIIQSTLTAQEIRQDVAKANGRLREQCGFSQILNKYNALKSGDCIEVKIAGTAFHLVNSPYKLG